MAKLTIINSCCGPRLRTEGCNGPLVLANEEDDKGCCCDECPEECSVTQYGLLQDDSGWSVDAAPTALPIEISFKYENASSTGCGGSNNNAQGGSVTCCFRLQEESTIELDVSGPVEQQNEGFDFGRIEVGGVTAKIGSFGRGLQCVMIDTQDTQTVVLPAGVHSYTITAGTNDGLWHQNMTHTFKIRKT
jgi:hypothetical protein